MARRKGFWSRLIETAKNLFTPSASSTPVERQSEFDTRETPTADTGGGGGGFGGGYGDPASSEVTGQTEVTEFDKGQFPFDFDIAGMLPLQGDFKSDYIDMEGGGFTVADVDWSSADYIVVRISEPGRDDYYTTIVGPFDDYDDWINAIAEWWEQGS